MPDDKNLDDLSIDEINELFNSAIEGPEEWNVAILSISPEYTDKVGDQACGGGFCSRL